MKFVFGKCIKCNWLNFALYSISYFVATATNANAHIPKLTHTCTQ